MTNYPPGVSGNEPQIAGPLSELTVVRACPERDVPYVPAFVVETALTWFENALIELRRTGQPQNELFLARARVLLDEHMAEFACDWEGDVEIVLWQDGTGVWTCPRCGTEHEEDIAEQMREDAILEQGERDRDWID